MFVIPDGPDEFVYALAVADEIRGLLPEAVVESDFSGRGIGKGLGRAGADRARAGRSTPFAWGRFTRCSWDPGSGKATP